MLDELFSVLVDIVGDVLMQLAGLKTVLLILVIGCILGAIFVASTPATIGLAAAAVLLFAIWIAAASRDW